MYRQCSKSVRYFNSQPHKEADFFQASVSERNLNFNSQPHKEADGEWVDVGIGREIFQLTASQGG